MNWLQVNDEDDVIDPSEGQTAPGTKRFFVWFREPYFNSEGTRVPAHWEVRFRDTHAVMAWAKDRTEALESCVAHELGYEAAKSWHHEIRKREGLPSLAQSPLSAVGKLAH
jgi:hypothetical protein